jgi:NAD(P)-dependent dehydrogenase (short-subunit alcohol dehydrogenase family)
VRGLHEKVVVRGGGGEPFPQTSPEEWQELIAINLLSAPHLHHAVLPGTVERDSGRVVTIASDAAPVGSSGEAVFASCEARLGAILFLASDDAALISGQFLSVSGDLTTAG